MRFPGGALRLVDFGSVQPAGRWVAPGHSRRYCAPEVARAVLKSVGGGMLKIHPAIDMWAAGLVLYELLVGSPVFSEAVTYAEVAFTANVVMPRESAEALPEAHQRLLTAVLRCDARERPSAADLLDKNVFKRADDTAERRRVEIAAFFSNPGNDLRLMREIQELLKSPGFTGR